MTSTLNTAGAMGFTGKEQPAGQRMDSDQEEPAGVGAARLNPPPRILAEGRPGDRPHLGGGGV